MYVLEIRPPQDGDVEWNDSEKRKENPDTIKQHRKGWNVIERAESGRGPGGMRDSEALEELCCGIL